MADEAPVSTDPSRIVGTVRNIGEPLCFSNVEPLAGFAAEAAKGGQQVKVWTKLALTSDDPLFHRLMENLANVIHHMAQQKGVGVNLRRADTVLLVLKPDANAELWLDTAAVSIRCAVKRAIAAGTVVFEQDIADITGMAFPCVTFGEGDKVLCLFRQDWSFGFAFDMNPEGKLDIDGFTTTLGTLYRELRYKHLYDALSKPEVFDRLLTVGWFPFAEIITAEFSELLHHCEAGFDVGEIEDRIIAKFDDARMQHILERWIVKPHFATKADLLKAAISAFRNKEPVAVIKILLTEIEGVLNDAHRDAHGGQGAKLKDLLAFVEASAEHKAGGSNTLLFPKAFGRYLREHTFANFDPIAQTGNAGSRHAVGHGAASQDSYTMPRALQAILTLDQFAFYT
ncbi:MAG TPA: hypothetical protein VI913_03295 [Candidatus Peribacteraceae bacterium]|nr:MAG: hypothetical protein A3G79_01115 [Gallionellales bacterium RIFCSPLOWO2_12_FULL_57_18]OGT18211.1 MAG: hypothetical protein A3J49_08785 [Gallionellales bacterium RIFCSPHIGHO2_02_FULL_57_16]HLD63894.1 hypothetical protein [Candidatus Peribacteraceae bacterium]